MDSERILRLGTAAIWLLIAANAGYLIGSLIGLRGGVGGTIIAVTVTGVTFFYLAANARLAPPATTIDPKLRSSYLRAHRAVNQLGELVELSSDGPVADHLRTLEHSAREYQQAIFSIGTDECPVTRLAALDAQRLSYELTELVSAGRDLVEAQAPVSGVNRLQLLAAETREFASELQRINSAKVLDTDAGTPELDPGSIEHPTAPPRAFPSDGL